VSDSEIGKMTFEAAMAELENVVSQLETGSVPLEESIKLYERGALLKAHCDAKLKSAEEKVALIVQGPDGNATGVRPAEIG
jgi:exodeoxyribonuclease VII small subunit